MNSLKGAVVRGKQRGKALGFPTANIYVPDSTEEGIFISKIKIQNVWFTSITFVGKAETFNDKTFQAESYILDFDKDLYGEKIEINLIKKIRENKKFGSPEELIKQMEQDKKQAQDYFNQ